MKSALVLAALSSVLLSGCLYETPLAPRPTEKVDRRLTGTWRSTEDASNLLTIRPFDAWQYVVVTSDGGAPDIYRAFTTEVAGLSLASVQELSSGRSVGRWAVFEYRLTPSGQLVLRMINDQVIPRNLRTPEALREAIRRNRHHPELFLRATSYRRLPAR